MQADALPGCNNVNLRVNNNNDGVQGSLRAVIANACAGSTITFDMSTIVSPINLTSGELFINKALTIQGPGANLLTVQRASAANFRIFHIFSGAFDAISGLTIANGNESGFGGGIFNQNGSSLTVTGCAISGNTASSGGGISIFNATVTVINSTISTNTATGSGGGINNNNGTVTVTNSTISNNIANGSGSSGGGIYTFGTLNLISSTISNNSASNGGGAYNFAGTINTRNTIIALNTSPTGPDVSGALTSQGFNLIGNSAGATILSAQLSDQILAPGSTINPLLGPLANNGGPTQTRALLANSPAIDKGHSSGSTTDQRGFARPSGIANNTSGGDGSDIGAFEDQTMHDSDGDGIPDSVEITEGTNPEVKDNDIFINTAQGRRLFVMQQYRDFLGREGDAPGITAWVNLLSNGTLTRAQVIQSFFNSPEFQQYGAPIVRLYLAYFLRIPDYAGQLFWTNQLRGGMSLDAISQVFATSPEFILTYGSLNNTQFITLVYQNVLNRTPSQAEVDAWVALLNQGAPRGQVMAGFSESPEFKLQSANKVFVIMMYVGMLRRAPEQAGFDGWVALLNGGTSGLQLIQGFLDAPEYHNRFLP